MNRGVVENEARLAILSYLTDQELTLDQTSLRTGFNPPRVDYHMRILCGEGLVRRRREGEPGPVVYATFRDDYPDWVREAVEAYCVRTAK